MDGRADAEDGHDRGQEESASFEAYIIAWIVMHRQIKARLFHGKTLALYLLVFFFVRGSKHGS